MRCKVFALAVTTLIGLAWVAAADAAEGSWTTYLYLNSINDIAVTDQGVWCAASGGALFYDFEESELAHWHRSNEGLASDTLTSVAILADSRIAFGTDKVGVSVYNPENKLWYGYNSAVWPLAGEGIRYIREDDVWRFIGTDQGFTAFENGEQRKICQQGLDICDLAGWEIKCGIYFDGYLWLGAWTDGSTGAGVSRYNYDNTSGDPGIWETLNEGLSNLNVWEFAVWNNTLYCATESGVAYWTGTTWERRSDGLSSEMTIYDLQVGAGSLYLAASDDENGGIYRLTSAAGEWSRLGDKQFHARCVAVGDDGIVWAGMAAVRTVTMEEHDGLWEYVGDQWIQHRAESPHQKSYYRTLTVAPDGDLWGATSGSGWRIVHNDGGDWSFYDEENTLLSNNWVFDLRFDEDRLWVGHCCCADPATVCKIDDWAVTDHDITTVSGVYNIYDSTQDDWGNLWFASYHEGYGNHPDRANGLHHYEKATGIWSNYTMDNTDDRIRSDAISAVAAEGRYLWVGYLDQGLTRIWLQADGTLPISSTGWTQYLPDDGGNPLIGDRVTCIAARPDEVWIGTDSGVSIYTRTNGVGSWRSFRASETQLPANGIVDIVLTAENAWLGFAGNGVTRMHRDHSGDYSFTTFSTPDLVNANVTSLAASGLDETVWIGTQAGLSRFISRSSVSVETVDDLYLYPNPYNPACGEPVRFQNLPGVCSGGVVVDVAGQIVKQIDEGLVRDDAFWDGRDDAGELVAPGLYLVRVSTPQGWLTGKVAIVDLLPCDD